MVSTAVSFTVFLCCPPGMTPELSVLLNDGRKKMTWLSHTNVPFRKYANLQEHASCNAFKSQWNSRRRLGWLIPRKTFRISSLRSVLPSSVRVRVQWPGMPKREKKVATQRVTKRSARKSYRYWESPIKKKEGKAFPRIFGGFVLVPHLTETTFNFEKILSRSRAEFQERIFPSRPKNLPLTRKVGYPVCYPFTSAFN